MDKIAVLNLKGGIGKTTTAVSLAYILAKKHGRRVLLIDCDMQGNASKALGCYDPDRDGTHSIMDGTRPADFLIIPTIYQPSADERGRNATPPAGCLDVIPSNMYLMQANVDAMRDTEREQLHRLSDALENVFPEGKNVPPYDICIMDCALGLDMTVLNAVIASDLIIAPVPFGGYEVDGLEELKAQLDDLQQIKPNLRMKALFTMKQGNKANKEFEEWLKTSSGYPVYETAIRRSVVVQKAAIEKKPLPAFSKRGIATQDYEAVALELLEDLRQIRETGTLTDRKDG